MCGRGSQAESNRRRRRQQLSRKFFTSLLQPSSCLHILLPAPRDPIITTRLRSANKFPRLPSRTRNTRHLFLTVLLITKLHNHFITNHHSICCFCIVCYFVYSIVLPIVLFGLTTTKLNKLLLLLTCQMMAYYTRPDGVTVVC